VSCFNFQSLKSLQIDDIARWPVYWQVVVVFIFFFVVQFIIGFFLILPQVNQWHLLTVQDVTQKRNEGQKEMLFDALYEIRETVKNQHLIRSKLVEFLPENRELLSILTTISQMANDNNIQITQMAWGERSSAQYWYRLPINIELVGHYHNIGYFSQSIAQLPILVDFNTLVLEPGDDDSGALKANMTAYTYQYRDVGDMDE